MIDFYTQYPIDEKCPCCNVHLEKIIYEIHEFSMSNNEGKALTRVMCPECSRIYNEEEITIIG